MAPGRLPDGLWRPWGPLGCLSQIFQRSGSSFGGRSGTRQATTTGSGLKLESSITLYRHFSLLGASRVTFGIHFGVLVWMLVWDPRREGEFLKIIEQSMGNQ